jgi:hypothetical protein
MRYEYVVVLFDTHANLEHSADGKTAVEEALRDAGLDADVKEIK